MTEFRGGILKTGHRARGSGIGLSITEIERAIFLDRLKRPVFYVNSAAAAGGSGRSWGGEFQTIHEASAYAPANSLVMVAPGHVETVSAAAGLVLGKAGLTVLGLGNGNRRPQVNFTTVVGADMDVGAAGIKIYNHRFTGGFDALTGPIDVNAADFALIDCITEDVTGQATDFIVTDANADRLSLVRWEHRGSGSAGADTAITIVGGADIAIEDAWIYGDFAVAGIENVTTAATRLNIYGGAHRPCYIETLNSADVLITLVATATGFVGPNIYGVLADHAANITEALVGADMQFMQPIYLANLAGERGMETNITATTG